MKFRWPALLLALSLLCGCRSHTAPEPPTQMPVPATDVTEPTEPVGFYAPEHPLETASGGALKVYPLRLSDAWEFCFMGDDLLLFSGSGRTTLTVLSGEIRYINAQTTLPCAVSLSDPGVTVGSDGITYPDLQAGELVLLDTSLKETGRIPLPAGICGSADLSEDRQTLYYCTEDGLRALEPATGKERLLSQITFDFQSVTALHVADSVVECTVRGSDGNASRLYFSAETGALLGEALPDTVLWTRDIFYFATCPDGAYTELISGSLHFGPSVLVTGNPDAAVFPVLETGGAVLASCEDSSLKLDYYSIEHGNRPYGLTLLDPVIPLCVRSDPSGAALWFLRFDTQSQQHMLCRWELEATQTGDTGYYLQSRYDSDHPDLPGLQQCARQAQQLSEKHGVEILLWQDAVFFSPWDYRLTPEYQVPLIEDRLEKLDDILSNYPVGFLKEAVSATGSGALRICLVRSIEGIPDTRALDSVVGVQFWNEQGEAYLAITLGEDMEQHLYHELFHIIDSRVLSSCGAYDNWNALNPRNFRYDYDYTANLQRDDWDLVSGDDKYFIDLYAMSFPKEDRARIMEYAMLPEQSAQFSTPAMQAKLRQLCLGIREAFHLEDTATVFRWEQYLTDPLSQ